MLLDLLAVSCQLYIASASNYREDNASSLLCEAEKRTNCIDRSNVLFLRTEYSTTSSSVQTAYLNSLSKTLARAVDVRLSSTVYSLCTSRRCRVSQSVARHTHYGSNSVCLCYNNHLYSVSQDYTNNILYQNLIICCSHELHDIARLQKICTKFNEANYICKIS